MDPSLARTLWHRLEALNAVAYFTEECRAAGDDLGLRGFWMGYFACRAAPLGPVGPGVVEATFHNFHPDRVRRAIPDAWTYASPAAVLETRAAAAAAALRRLLGGQAELVAEAVAGDLAVVVAAADPGGRPLFAANRDVALPDDPVAGLWQLATTLREHRGDGHVALLAGAGIDGCEAHVLAAAAAGTPADLYLQSRGWSADDWAAATDRLAGRGLVRDGALTDAGRALHGGIEDGTDALAAQPYAAIGDERVRALLDVVGPAATTVLGSGEIGFPNPMGLPAPT